EAADGEEEGAPGALHGGQVGEEEGGDQRTGGGGSAEPAEGLLGGQAGAGEVDDVFDEDGQEVDGAAEEDGEEVEGDGAEEELLAPDEADAVDDLLDHAAAGGALGGGDGQAGEDEHEQDLGDRAEQVGPGQPPPQDKAAHRGPDHGA